MYNRGVNTSLAGSCLHRFGKGVSQKRQFQNEGRDFLSNRTRQSLLIPPLLMAREGWRRDMYVNN
jgi:hypothetical protein